MPRKTYLLHRRVLPEGKGLFRSKVERTPRQQRRKDGDSHLPPRSKALDGPGFVVLFGSGETSPSGRKVYEWIFARLAAPIRVAVLETPAGFQPNSPLVAQKICDFLGDRLQNYRPETTVVPARQMGSANSPDDPDILAPMLRANALFMGPGSPTYAVRQLQHSLAWAYLQALHRRGNALLLASAATIAVSSQSLPVYEIYKSGEDLHWRPGLDLFGPFGLSLVFVPHWDNSEGGAELDTSHCFMGRERFQRLLAMLPPDSTVVGIDEHTALVMDLRASTCRVIGRGGVTLLREGQETRYDNGRAFPAESLGSLRIPEPREGIRVEAWRAALAAGVAQEDGTQTPPTEVTVLVEQREKARAEKDWPLADLLRGRIAELGWRVSDTPEGPILEPMAR